MKQQEDGRQNGRDTLVVGSKRLLAVFSWNKEKEMEEEVEIASLHEQKAIIKRKIKEAEARKCNKTIKSVPSHSSV